jgi:hypothetical protein
MSSVLVNGGITTDTTTPCGAISSASAADKAHHPELGAHVDDLPRNRDQSGQRRDVDDVAAAARDHVRQRQLATGQHPVQVDLDRGADRLLGLFEERADRHHARVVDQHIDVPPPSVRALSRNVANDSRSVTSSGSPRPGRAW